MSELVYNLISDTEQLQEMKMDIVRLSPQSQNMSEVVKIWKNRLAGQVDGKEALAKLLELNGDVPFCNGYFHERPGLEYIQE